MLISDISYDVIIIEIYCITIKKWRKRKQ